MLLAYTSNLILRLAGLAGGGGVTLSAEAEWEAECERDPEAAAWTVLSLLVLLVQKYKY